MKVEITIDDTITGAIRRIIEAELGQVSIQITRIDKVKFQVDIDADLTPEQKNKMRNDIINLLEGLGKYPTFEVIE